MNPTKESFLKDVTNHQLTVLLNNGVYRHIRLMEPGCSNMYFDIVTYPGYLVFCGDMGSYVFTRVQDMFTFFRGDEPNPRYWSEKLEAVDSSSSGKRSGDCKDFEWEVFERDLLELCDSLEQKAWLSEELSGADQDEYGAVEFLRNFDDDNEVNLSLTDDWGCIPDGKVWSYRFLWACFAIPWAIEQFDLKVESEAA
ncbi:hypothetical protein [Ferrimonas aestuarii]|uniref:Uncharacterized protein n=1 Tax=Ferrimonas aestuarii TaxID=2569539 RepID=A0A4U1BNE4_9GAMM|nr:hypothetical protein [Ferrimonas aestuarii]TKB53282.1 hypothetical protein FCL42_14515 [Ferrimonas aestuarii]